MLSEPSLHDLSACQNQLQPCACLNCFRLAPNFPDKLLPHVVLYVSRGCMSASSLILVNVLEVQNLCQINKILVTASLVMGQFVEVFVTSQIGLLFIFSRTVQNTVDLPAVVQAS